LTTAADAPSRKPGRGIKILLPTILVLLLAVGWSAFWWYAARQAETRLAAFLDEAAADGRTVTCDENRFSGYPFRLEWRCGAAAIAVDDPDQAFTLTTGGITAVAQIYQPTHVILEAIGPVRYAPAGGDHTVEAAFSGAEASIVFGVGGPERASLVVSDLTATEKFAGLTNGIVSDGRLEAHVRRGTTADSYDLVARLDAADLPPVDAAMGGPAPVKLELQATVTGLDPILALPPSERLRAWAEGGGAVDITYARLDRGPTSAKAAGKLGLDADGHPTGEVAVTLAGVNEFSAALKQGGIAPANVANLLGLGLAMLGKPSNIDGKPAVEVPLRLSNGKAAVGSFSAGATPKLF